ncbi:methionyl-tRNA formyltransferase [Paenarthrobacter sp. Z7-10]|uniref:methionyl-tRNA formyltransferase n=1 Tax=Paenarthrobacter sp. Z7-10 TaxID=2787635 RepID=UPI0022A95A28|nr:methionyl-tRNA formyltransferase [Paenarthrobacter sp. Z7-10]MCZ2403399.1 methionyl-tRNA formyltransferase [Paenarthrobacter sp. Z7-10]
MRVLFAGTPGVAIPSLDALVSAGFDVVAVLTRPDAPVGRKRILTPSPVAAHAQELAIPVIHAARIDAAAAQQIAACRPDVAAIVAYGALIPAAALSIPAQGWINLHFSLLPSWRGAAPVQHAVINGDAVSGASTFRLETGLDTGPVFDTVTEPVQPQDTSTDLLGRLAHRGAALLTQTLREMEAGRAQARVQQGTVTLAPKLTIEDARIDWAQPANRVGARIRGVTVEPGAWTTLAGQRLKLGPVLLRSETMEMAPGALRVEAGAVLVGTLSHAVELVQVQPAGKKMMQAKDWARGLADTEGMVLV